MPTSPPTSILETLTQRAGRLYTLPAVAVQVLELTKSPQVDVPALKECLENDPALVSKVLKVVNSSLYGLMQPVCDLNQALALLGTKPLKMLVLGFSLPRELFGSVDAIMLGRYWQHTLTRAVAAREIAVALFAYDGDEAFVAGLLQDVGLLVLIEQLGEPYCRFVREVDSLGASLAAHELDLLGFDHCVLSARLLRQWSFPEAVPQAVAAVHDTAEIGKLPEQAQTLAKVLHLAELTSQLFAGKREECLQAIVQRGTEFCAMTVAQYEEVVRALAPKVAALAEVYSLQLPETDSVDEILARSHRRLVEVAEAAVTDMLSESPEESLWLETRSLAAALECFRRGNPRPTGVESKDGETATGPETREVEPSPRAANHSLAHFAVAVGLEDLVATAMNSCRQLRRPLSLLSVAIDHVDELRMSTDAQEVHACQQHLHDLIVQVAPVDADVVVTESGALAVILRQHDREESLGLARELLRRVGQWSQRRVDEGSLPMSVSIGVASLAMPPKNFPPAELATAADRCRYAAQAASGDTVKSISL